MSRAAASAASAYSWYVYSPLRIKYPYLRGVLMDPMGGAPEPRTDDPVEAWASIVEDAEKREQLPECARKGRLSARELGSSDLEIMVASMLYTAKKYGPDRVIGFSPIPAMSMLSYAAGTRFLQLFGGVILSFYDWYCDFPPASPEIWGEQTDVAESADWYQRQDTSPTWAPNLNMTRTPDCAFLR